MFGTSPIYPDGSQKAALAKQYIGSGSRFTLTNVKADAAGLYECIAENTKTSLSTSQLFRVDIKRKTHLIEFRSILKLKFLNLKTFNTNFNFQIHSASENNPSRVDSNR